MIRCKTKLVLSLAVLAIMIMLPLATVQALTVSTNKEKYYPGDELVVSGTATPNAIVSIVVNNPAGSLVAIDQVTAGGDGSFSDTVLKFPAQETAQFPYGTYTIVVKDTATGEEQTVTVEFASPAAVITGTVVSEKGTPISGATVKVYKGTALVALKTTGADGKFKVEVLETGTYTIEVSASGYVTATKTVDVTELPSTVSVTVTLKEQKLAIEVTGITRDGKPLLGVAREGETLEVHAKVTYGSEVITDAVVKGYLTSGLREQMGLPPIEFDLVYNPDEGAYVGTVEIPVAGVDRQCTLKLEATSNGMTATYEESFITLVNSPQDIADLEKRVKALEEQLTTLSDTIKQLQTTVGTLQGNLDSLTKQLQTLQDTVKTLQSQIGNLAAKQDVANLQNTVKTLQDQLNNMQSQVNNLQKQLDDLNNNVGALSGAKSIAYAAIVVGIIAIIIAIASMAYLNKKIAAAA